MSAENADEISPELVNALHNKIKDLEARVDELEGNGSGGGRSTDGRDEAVLDQLAAGERVRLSQLKKLFRTHTDIRNERTIKNRVRTLTKRPEFEQVGHGVWEFNGGSDE